MVLAASINWLHLISAFRIIAIAFIAFSFAKFSSSSTRRILTTQKTTSRRKIGHDSLRRKEVPVVVPARRPEAEESSTMDESSLASLIEDKKSIEKFEKEVAVMQCI